MLSTESSQPLVITPTLKRLFDRDQEVFGIRLGEFVLEGPLGTGGMGAVFRAHDARLGRKVALKVLSPDATLDSQLVSRFHNEARATARLSHDNIARVYSSGEDLGVHYIAYELIDGTNLRELIAAKGTVSPSDAVSFAIQIAMALNHTVAAGVVHRDIKPSNIIITPEGRARAVDLGLARRESDDSIADLTVAGA
ncbi:MAG: serine/threonine-protein kinase, partial [Planctomycetaceae bacterium]